MAASFEIVTDENAGFFARLVFWLTRRKLRKMALVPKVPGPVRALAHHSPLLAAYGAFELGLERSERVPARLKSLAMLRVATLVGCPF
jgi:hypothetical protein